MAYMLGFYLGKFAAGAVIGGLIPFIICAVKKNWKKGLLSMLVCGLVSFIHPVASLAAGVAMIVYAIKG
ncbi:MAG: hypothetical protein IKU34_09780 [Clostridia bacterium]|nr:hypothetical protein [Clostridia bacterium]